jgi:formate/nitrite transporter FocA (FNT family)
MSTEFNINALMPQEMAEKAESIGVRKAGMAFFPLFALSILAGAFIGVGAMFATTGYTGSSTLPYGVAR